MKVGGHYTERNRDTSLALQMCTHACGVSTGT
jgi:hypothetical protein